MAPALQGDCARALDDFNAVLRDVFGRLGCVELVAISNPGRLTAVFELLHESQVVIARNAKDVPNASFLQTAKNKVSNRLSHDTYLQGIVITMRARVRSVARKG